MFSGRLSGRKHAFMISSASNLSCVYGSDAMQTTDHGPSSTQNVDPERDLRGQHR
jgi:hypothetical protein